MAIGKICGTETEYGIHTLDGDANPIAASSVLVNAYTIEAEGKIDWDFEDENPSNDARGYLVDGSLPPLVETHLANTVLTNGARFYVDHAHPEYSTPECADPLEVVVHDRAGEEVLRRAVKAASRIFPESPKIVIYKNNSDGKGNSYGCHENYLVDRAVPFASIVAGVVPHFISRIIYTGAGKVGSETEFIDERTVPFQISQRAEFFEEIIGLETTLKRPIVNTRDEPHADPARFRRLHVIIGDANLSELATFLKVGTTAVLLAMIEDEVALSRDIAVENPVLAFHQISSDVTLHEPIALADGSKATALEMQWEIFDAARKYHQDKGLQVVGPDHVTTMLMDRWESVLEDLETDPTRLNKQLDWVAKKQLVEGYQDRHGLGPLDHRLCALDLQYHDLRPERSLFQRLGMETLVDQAVVDAAVTNPPKTTRAWFRGSCLARWPEAVVAANWDSLVFDVGADPLRRVPMMDPMKGTAEHTGALLEKSASPAELLEFLNA